MPKYNSITNLLNGDPKAKKYFNTLPGYVQEAIMQRGHNVNSFESLCHYADNLTEGDK